MDAGSVPRLRVTPMPSSYRVQAARRSSQPLSDGCPPAPRAAESSEELSDARRTHQRNHRLSQAASTLQQSLREAGGGEAQPAMRA